jgi:predicted RNase H-like HicB family nuclease
VIEVRYPVLVEPGTQKTAYGVVVPDLPGCFAAGETLDEALHNAREAVLLHLEGLLDEGELVPDASPLERHARDPEYSGWIRAIIDVDISQIQGPARRINVTIPARVLHKIDAAAARAHETRSGFLARAGLLLARAQQTVTRRGRR